MSTFKDLDKQIKNKFEDNYKGETNIAEILDLSRFKDDVDGLIEEMLKQPSIYAYWANLRRVAEEKYNSLNEKFEILKARKRRSVVEQLALEGDKKPNVKTIEVKMTDLCNEDEVLKKYNDHIKLWKKRKEQLYIIERAISSRESSFKSLSYLLSSMMKTQLGTPSKQKHLT